MGLRNLEALLATDHERLQGRLDSLVGTMDGPQDVQRIERDGQIEQLLEEEAAHQRRQHRIDDDLDGAGVAIGQRRYDEAKRSGDEETPAMKRMCSALREVCNRVGVGPPEVFDARVEEGR